MLTTARAVLPYPEAADPDDVPGFMRQLAQRLDTVGGLVRSTTAALRGASGTAGTHHYATDTGLLSFDTGTAWLPIDTVPPSALRLAEAVVDPNETTVSTTFTDLPTYGPALDVIAPPAGIIRVGWSAGINVAAGSFGLITPAIFTGTTTVRTPNDGDAITATGDTGTRSREILQGGLTPGQTYRVTLMARSQGGASAAFYRRRLIVIPSP